ncbi:MAG: hypothetical protein RSD51_03905 [Malacoplasma sp.]
MVFDFWDIDGLKENLSILYGINKVKLEDILVICDVKDRYINENILMEFIKLCQIKDIDSIDVTNVKIKGRHITTASKGFTSFKKFGLLDAYSVLTYETPLRFFY